MIVTLLTDFGTSDHYAAVMKGVILAADPAIALVDLGHEIAPGDVAHAAFSLLAAYPYFPPGTVHVVVVDPGVGTERRVVAVQARDQIFVGPDNGVFSYVLDREPAARVHEVTSERYHRKPVSSTFHGRDVFAPLGAALAGGLRPEELGPPLEAAVRLPPLSPGRTGRGTRLGRVLHVDRFGNCVTSIAVHDLPAPRALVRARAGTAVIGALRRTYAGAPASEPFLIWGSSGLLEISLNGASAAAALGLRPGSAIEVDVEQKHGRTTSEE